MKNLIAILYKKTFVPTLKLIFDTYMFEDEILAVTHFSISTMVKVGTYFYQSKALLQLYQKKNS